MIDIGEEIVVAVRSNTDVVEARRRARELAIEVGLSLVGQTKVVTATSELARNCLTYGGGGQVRLCRVREQTMPPRSGMRIMVRDEGPGIPDVELAMTDGWTSGAGLGLGLSGVRKLAGEFAIDTTAGAGTTVTAVFWRY